MNGSNIALPESIWKCTFGTHHSTTELNLNSERQADILITLDDLFVITNPPAN
jgi:hypothetical protein